MKGIVCVAVAAWLAASLGQPANAAEQQNGRSDETSDADKERHKRCRLGNGIKQIVYLQFDNTHLKRDNPSVPSDLEQMPTLYNFLKDNGTLGFNSHTVLISHTAAGIISTLTGVYPDRTGTGLSNSFNYYQPDGTAPFISTFGYWTNIIPDSAPLMVDEEGKIAPAPWVAFTRAGCDVGNVSVANTVLENNSSDVVNVFGADSPEASETSAQKTADFVGIAIDAGPVGTGGRLHPRRKGDRGAIAFVSLAVANQGEPGCLSAAGDRIQAAQRSVWGSVYGEHQILNREYQEHQPRSLRQLSAQDGVLHRAA